MKNRDDKGRFVKGHTLPEKSLIKMKKSLKGKIPWNKNKKLSSQYKEKIKRGVLLTYKHKPELHKIISENTKKGMLKNNASAKIKMARMKQIIPTRDTSIEVKMQNILKENNIEFEKHKAIVGQPDIFIKPNICIFCDGDYWHNRPERKNRDKYVNRKLKEQGYNVLRFWEHTINTTIEICVTDIKKYI